MFLMSLWLCNALRGSTSQSNLFLTLCSINLTVTGLAFLSWSCYLPYVLKSLFWSRCRLCWRLMFWVWIVNRCCISVPCLLWEQFPILHISPSLCLCLAHDVCHIQSLLVTCLISQDILTQYLIINTSFLYLRSCWKRVSESTWEESQKVCVFCLGSIVLLAGSPRLDRRECGTTPHQLFCWGFMI